MKAQLTPVHSFVVRLGDTGLGTFTVESSWEGFSKLINKQGEVLIVRGIEADGLAESFDRIFGRIFDPANVATEVDIVTASPGLVEQIKP